MLFPRARETFRAALKDGHHSSLKNATEITQLVCALEKIKFFVINPSAHSLNVEVHKLFSIPCIYFFKKIKKALLKIGHFITSTEQKCHQAAPTSGKKVKACLS